MFLILIFPACLQKYIKAPAIFLRHLSSDVVNSCYSGTTVTIIVMHQILLAFTNFAKAYDIY